MSSEMFFSYDPEDVGFKFHDSEEEAKKEAQLYLDEERRYAREDGEWLDEAHKICYGVVLGRATDQEADSFKLEDFVLEETEYQAKITKLKAQRDELIERIKSFGDDLADCLEEGVANSHEKEIIENLIVLYDLTVKKSLDKAKERVMNHDELKARHAKELADLQAKHEAELKQAEWTPVKGEICLFSNEVKNYVSRFESRNESKYIDEWGNAWSDCKPMDWSTIPRSTWPKRGITIRRYDSVCFKVIFDNGDYAYISIENGIKLLGHDLAIGESEEI